jgi:hypothetical protein
MEDNKKPEEKKKIQKAEKDLASKYYFLRF